MSEEYERLKEALRKSPMPEAREAAAEAMRRYLASHPPKSKPTLVSLGYKKPYPTAIKVEDIPGELERNPEFFKYLQKIVKA